MKRHTSQFLLASQVSSINKKIPVKGLESYEKLDLKLVKAIAYSLATPYDSRDILIWKIYKATRHRQDVTRIALVTYAIDLISLDQITAVDFTNIGREEFKEANPEFLSKVVSELKYLL